MLTKEKCGNESVPITIELPSNKLIWYTPTSDDPLVGVKSFTTNDSFEPWHWSDAVIYVCGRRGSGKSYYVNLYLKNYYQYTSNRVFYFSRFEQDPSINLPDRSMWIQVKDIESCDLNDMKNSLMIFDDINDSRLTLKDQKNLQKFILDTIENSRKFGISCILTSHMIYGTKFSQTILSEMSSLVVFPQFSNKYQIERALSYYMKMTKEQIETLKNTQDRWVQIEVNNPQFVLSEHELYLYQ
jgi:hypothetical protein